MDDLIIDNESKDIILNSQSIENLMPSDPLFANKIQDNRNKFIEFIRQSPSFINIFRTQMKPGHTYSAKIPSEVLKKLKSGDAEKIIDKITGLWDGMIRDSETKIFICKAKFEKVELSAANKFTSPEMLNNLSSLAIQSSIADLTEKLLEMDKKLDQIIGSMRSDRIAKIKSGIDMYQAAIHYNNIDRNLQLSNALQSLNEGRRCLMGELEPIFMSKRHERIGSDWFYEKILFIKNKKSDVDFFNECKKNYKTLKEMVRYTNLSSSYIFRIHTLLDAPKAANESMSQYVAFCKTLVRGVDEISRFLPPGDFVDEIHKFDGLRRKTECCIPISSNLILEVDYKEVINE